jgi:NAD(P)-dependent dehydrogenase (short-subunit alcohol dehydrogenase family)
MATPTEPTEPIQPTEPTEPAGGTDLTDRVVIITGASRGIGKGLALGLAGRGAAVVCAARTETEQPGGLPGSVQTTAREITAAGGRALAVRCDIGVEAHLAGLIQRAVEVFGRLDVLINNAMAPTRGPIVDATVAMWDESMTTNVRSLFVVSRLALPYLGQRGGSIINMSSGAADHASTPFLPPGFAIYATAKAALERFTTAIAPEFAARGIAVNALRPGAVKTEMAVHELGDDHDWSGWTTPDAVVPPVAYLAAQRGDGLTGQILESTQFGRRWP